MVDLIIFSKDPKWYAPARFFEEAEKAGLKTLAVPYSSLTFHIETDRSKVFYQGEELPKAKMALFRSAGGDGFYIPQRDYLLEKLGKEGTYILNEKTYRRWSRLDKITQHFEFQLGNLPFVESLNFCSSEELLNTHPDFPFILKHNLSSQGRDVHKITSDEQLKELIPSRYSARTTLVQPFLKAGEDLRVIVLGGKAIGAMRRRAQEGHYLTNFSVGGIVEAYDLTKDMKRAREIAEETANYFDTEYVGVDLMSDENGDWKLLEINRACQFEGFEKSTGINVAKEVVSYLVEKCR